MSLTNWILMYLIHGAFWSWVLFFEGAYVIGDTFLSGIFTFLISLKWRELSPEGVKIFGVFIMVMHSILFVIGLLMPPIRMFFRLF